MYHAKIWDEDKLNITSSYSSSKYGNIFAEGSDKKEDKQYNEQKYGSNDSDVSSDYMRNKKMQKRKKTKRMIFLMKAKKKSRK